MIWLWSIIAFLALCVTGLVWVILGPLAEYPGVLPPRRDGEGQ